MGHMAKSLCAELLVSEGKIKSHNSNGTFCAVLEECVYVTCTNKKDRITGLGCGKVEVVNMHTTHDGTAPVTCFRRDCVHWVKLTKEAWDTLTNPPTPPGKSNMHPFKS